MKNREKKVGEKETGEGDRGNKSGKRKKDGQWQEWERREGVDGWMEGGREGGREGRKEEEEAGWD